MMHSLRRSVTALAPRATRVVKQPSIMGVLSRNLITFDEKEKGEEAAYIHKIENERKIARQKKMEEVLARDDSDEHKKALLTIVGDGDENKLNYREISMVKHLGLDDWKVAFPLAMCFAPPMIHHQFIIVDYKFYLVGAFCLMWHAYDAVVMPIWAEKTDWIQNDITSFWKKVDDQAVEEIDNSIKSNEDFVESKELFQDMFNAVDAISETRAVAMNKANHNAYHRAVQKKLDALASLNEATSAAIRSDMVESVKAEVAKNLESPKVKESALAQAIANLAAGANSPRGKDIVGEQYAKAIANYKAGISSKDHRVHHITAKLESEIAEICKPVEVPQSAGNVYETHPVL